MENLTGRLKEAYDTLKDIKDINLTPDKSIPPKYLQVSFEDKLVATIFEESKEIYNDFSLFFKLKHIPQYRKLKSV